MDNQTVGERVRSFRKRRRMNQAGLARLIRRSERWLIDLEQGRGDPKMSDIYQIAHILKVRATDLMTDTFQPVASNGASSDGSSRQTITPATSTLIVESEEAQLRYDRGVYLARMRRALYNGGDEPITSYLVRISVDRHPGDPDESKKLYRIEPLTWDELNLSASCEGEPLVWTVKYDRDAEKEAYVHFRTPTGRHLPLYPGSTMTLEYSYTVTDKKWGNWFQRAIRWPTKDLQVRLEFPRSLAPIVWGTESSATAENVPLKTPITREDEDDFFIFRWSTEDPPLHSRYRLEWRFASNDSVENQCYPVSRWNR